MGIESRKGIPTFLGKAIANELAFRENRANVIAIANSFKESTKKKKD
jgi:hypothetical protein